MGYAELTAQRLLKSTSLDEKRNLQLTEGWKVFFKDVNVNNVIGVFRKEERSAIKENDLRLMLPSAKAQCDAQGLNWAMRFTRIP
jgi:hypothetical protein